MLLNLKVNHKINKYQASLRKKYKVLELVNNNKQQLQASVQQAINAISQTNQLIDQVQTQLNKQFQQNQQGMK